MPGAEPRRVRHFFRPGCRREILPNSASLTMSAKHGTVNGDHRLDLRIVLDPPAGDATASTGPGPSAALSRTRDRAGCSGTGTVDKSGLPAGSIRGSRASRRHSTAVKLDCSGFESRRDPDRHPGLEKRRASAQEGPNQAKERLGEISWPLDAEYGFLVRVICVGWAAALQVQPLCIHRVSGIERIENHPTSRTERIDRMEKGGSHNRGGSAAGGKVGMSIGGSEISLIHRHAIHCASAHR